MTFDELLRQIVREEAEAIRADVRALRAEVLALRDAGDPAEMVDVPEVARLIGKSEGALRRQVERCTFPVKPVRVGRLLRWRKRDIIAMANGNADDLERRRRGSE